MKSDFISNYDLNYYFNATNIPNQDLVFDTFDYFDTGDGKDFFTPIDFLNTLNWHLEYIKKNIDKPFEIIQHLKDLELEEMHRHILISFILKWFGGYPVNNLDQQYNSLLRLVERQYLSFIKNVKKSYIDFKEQFATESANNGRLIANHRIRSEKFDNTISLLDNLDKIIKNTVPNTKLEELKNVLQVKSIKDSIEAKDKSIVNPFVFVSHSSKDKTIVTDFIDKILKLCLKIDTDQIFYTSLEETTIRSGEDFRGAIKDNLQKASLVVLIITDNYRTSEVCLNEMGAIWVLNNRVAPFIVPPIQYSSVGFIHEPNQLLKLNDKENILKFIDEEKTSSNKIKHTEIERHVNAFLELIESNIITTPIEKHLKNKPKPVGDFDLEENTVVEITNRAGLYVYKNNKLRFILDSTPFSLFVYGFDVSKKRIFVLSDVEFLIDNGNPIPNLYNCKILIENTSNTKWAIIDNERRFLPTSVYARLVKHYTDGNKVSSITYENLIKYREGDRLNDIDGKFN